jgi:hypothetical protein
MAKQRKEWPRLPLPAQVASITVADVVAAAPGPPCDAMIRKWCESVWEVWHGARPHIVEIARAELGVE